MREPVCWARSAGPIPGSGRVRFLRKTAEPLVRRCWTLEESVSGRATEALSATRAMKPTDAGETMHASPTADARPEAMGDVPGVCELPLTRAIVQYRDVHEMDAPGGRIEDIGLALVVEGRYAATSEAIDLGTGVR